MPSVKFRDERFDPVLSGVVHHIKRAEYDTDIQNKVYCSFDRNAVP